MMRYSCYQVLFPDSYDYLKWILLRDFKELIFFNIDEIIINKVDYVKQLFLYQA